jgi:glycogen synthase
MREQIKQKYNAGRATGIVNAPRKVESPEKALGIKRYGEKDFEKMKLENKKDFQKEMGLIPDPDIPLYVWTNRLSEQKGIGQFIPQIKHLSGKYDVQMAFIADGEKEYENALRNISLDSGGMIAYSNFEGNLERQAFAGGDFLLMPSLYEPCGLPQMTCKRYGTLPVVRKTGGLADTVKPLDFENNTGSGFVFDIVDRPGFEYAIEESIKFYVSHPEIRNKNIQRIMRQGKEEHSLEKTAEQYLEIYDKLAREK